MGWRGWGVGVFGGWVLGNLSREKNIPVKKMKITSFGMFGWVG